MRTLQNAKQSIALATASALAVVGFSATAAADTPTDKFLRGLAGMTTGFLEVPGNIVEESERIGPAYGIPLGFVKGLGGIVVRELVGVYDFVTAPIEVPEDYQPLIEPEYPWGYFDDGERDVAERGSDPRVSEDLGG